MCINKNVLIAPHIKNYTNTRHLTECRFSLGLKVYPHCNINTLTICGPNYFTPGDHSAAVRSAEIKKNDPKHHTNGKKNKLVTAGIN